MGRSCACAERVAPSDLERNDFGMTLACVLISDITGSTQLYERESNETALERIAPVLDRMRLEVERVGRMLQAFS